MDHEKLIRDIVTNALGVEAEGVSVIRRLMGGMSNSTYVVEAGGEHYTFRVPGKHAERFVDREVEADHLKLIESLRINNETVYLDVVSGYKIARYLEGVPMSETGPYEHLEAAADVLRRVHTSGLKSRHDYDPFGRLRTYEAYVKEHGHVHEERYENIKSTFLAHRPALEAHRKTLCHGDAQISNFVVSERMYLTDWEFAGNHDPFYDIACFGNVDFDHALALFPVYLQRRPHAAEMDRLYLWRTFQCLQWHNVALYKHFIGLSEDLAIDFEQVAKRYLDKAQAMLSAVRDEHERVNA